MKITGAIARHLREIHFGDNWTCSSLLGHLTGVTWQQAVTEVHDFNSIATLTYHIHYYVAAVLRVLQGDPLQASDKLSFELPPVTSQNDWDAMLERLWADAEQFAILLEQMPDEKLAENIADPAYGSFYRNLHGIIEHTHYHLGQIVLIKKLVAMPLPAS